MGRSSRTLHPFATMRKIPSTKERNRRLSNVLHRIATHRVWAEALLVSAALVMLGLSVLPSPW
jgi:hypothetical protein